MARIVFHSSLSHSISENSSNFSSAQLGSDALSQQFTQHVLDPINLLAMTAGGLSYRLARVASLSALSTLPSLIRSPLVSAFSLTVEVATFRAVNHVFLINPESYWDKQGFVREMSNFASLKGVAALMKGGNFLSMHAAQNLGMMAGEEATTLLHLIPESNASFAERFVQASVTNLALGVGTSLSRIFTGHHILVLERSFERNTERTLFRQQARNERREIFSLMRSEGEGRRLKMSEISSRGAEVANYESLEALFKFMGHGKVARGVSPVLKYLVTLNPENEVKLRVGATSHSGMARDMERLVGGGYIWFRGNEIVINGESKTYTSHYEDAYYNRFEGGRVLESAKPSGLKRVAELMKELFARDITILVTREAYQSDDLVRLAQIPGMDLRYVIAGNRVVMKIYIGFGPHRGMIGVGEKVYCAGHIFCERQGLLEVDGESEDFLTDTNELRAVPRVFDELLSCSVRVGRRSVPSQQVETGTIVTPTKRWWMFWR